MEFTLVDFIFKRLILLFNLSNFLMDIGSLVECIANFEETESEVIIPIRGNIYVVRDILAFEDGLGVYLEEIINPKKKYLDATERAFSIKGFREIQPPMQISIENLVQEFNEV